MPKFLIEVPHQADTVACARVVQVFLASGSHYLSHAEWGCMDGVHSSFMIVEVDSKAEARGIVPPAFRAEARIVGLTQFNMTQIEETLRRHGASTSPGATSGG